MFCFCSQNISSNLFVNFFFSNCASAYLYLDFGSSYFNVVLKKKMCVVVYRFGGVHPHGGLQDGQGGGGYEALPALCRGNICRHNQPR